MFKRTILFLLINFTALAIGGLFTGDGVSSNWYQELNKAPWTPPGWVFGFAWTTIMICFSLYMAWLWNAIDEKQYLVNLFALQFVLNIAWNPVFFYFQGIGLGMLIIAALSVLMIFFLAKYCSLLKWRSVLVLPYVLWLLIASSLNLYILLNN